MITGWRCPRRCVSVNSQDVDDDGHDDDDDDYDGDDYHGDKVANVLLFPIL